MEKNVNYHQRTTFFRLLILIAILAALASVISSCTLPDLGGLLIAFDPTQAPLSNPASPTPSPSATPDVPAVQSRTLTIWVPPQFDPYSGSAAADLFLARLDEFIARRPQTEILVRVKEIQGEFGLIEALRLTGAAAPILQPDLIALPRPLMEQAFREGLIKPLDDISGEFSSNDWFDYAQDMSWIAGSTAGLPFAGDLLVMAYKTDSGENPPQDWESLLSSQKPISFPASDTRGLVTLAIYQSLGGSLVDEAGEISLNADLMLEVLQFYKVAQSAGVMPYWLTQFETREQAWQSYQDRQSTLALSWNSIILSSDSPNTSLAALPTKEGNAYSYGSGWVWSVVPSNLDNESVALELAEFLSAEEYLSEWGPAAGYLPVQVSALSSWSEKPYYGTLQKLLPAAVLMPGNSLLAEIGPYLKNAAVSVLKDQVDPQAALDVLFAEISTP